MSVAVITGSAGLIGSEATRYFAGLGFEVVGIENDMRARFFGDEASTSWNQERLKAELGTHYRHADFDIRDTGAVNGLFAELGKSVTLVIHTAAQPSHDWAVRDPQMDFGVNAVGTLNMLEAARQHCPGAAFIFTSTNKVYGDTPNRLPLRELETRWEIDAAHPYTVGIDEAMSIDGTLHSLFGASKVAADVLVQEYGRYFGMPTVCFRGGCLTGPNHSGTALHGFLAYLMRCTATGKPYTVFGYGGKQVRDNIHSADLIGCFDAFRKAPRAGEVYNIGGWADEQCIDAGGDRDVREDCRAGAATDVQGGEPGGRSHLVDQRYGEVSRALSGVGAAVRRAWILEAIYENNFERWKAQGEVRVG